MGKYEVPQHMGSNTLKSFLFITLYTLSNDLSVLFPFIIQDLIVTVEYS